MQPSNATSDFFFFFYKFRKNTTFSPHNSRHVRSDQGLNLHPLHWKQGVLTTGDCAHLHWLFATLYTVTHQAPLSVGFSRQEYLSGFPFPLPGDLPDPGVKPVSPALQVDSLLLSHQGLPRCVSGKESACQCRRSKFNP